MKKIYFVRIVTIVLVVLSLAAIWTGDPTATNNESNKIALKFILSTLTLLMLLVLAL